MAESKGELKSLLMKVKEEREKAGLLFSIQKTVTMASGSSTPWQIDGKTMETVRVFIFLGSKITAAMKLKDACSLGKKKIEKLRKHIKKQRHYFANKGPSTQSYGFSSSLL